MNPIVFAMRHPITMMMLVVALIGAGGLAMFSMRIDIFPPVNLPQIYVIQNFNGMSPAQMEGLIVNQFELNFQYVDGVKTVESKSIQQIALIKLSFYPGTDMSQAVAEVVAQANRAQASMPPGVLPPQIMRMDAGSVPIGYLVLRSRSETLGTLADLAQQRIRPLLQANVPGTVGTAPFGSNVRAIVINVDPDRLRAYNLTPDEVVKALTTGNVIVPAGNLYIKDEMPIVPTNATIVDIQEIGKIPLRPERNVYIRDVATIADSTDVNFGYALVDGHRSVYIPVVKKNTASTLTVVSEIHRAMPAFKNVLPEGVDISYEFDESPTVVEAVRSVAIEGLIGASLTGLMILLFLRDWRSVIVVVFNIPMALLGSLFALWVVGDTINIMTLGGLALAIGMLVDEATVSIENIHVQMTRTPSLARAVERGSNETAVARLLAMLCILSVFIPAFIMAEPVRSLFVPLSLAVGFAMITSYFLSSTLVPVLSVWLLKHHGQHGGPREGEAPPAVVAPPVVARSPDRATPPTEGLPAAAWHGQETVPQQEGLQASEWHGQETVPQQGHGQETVPQQGGGFFERVQDVFSRVVAAGVRLRWVVVPAYVVVCGLILWLVGTRLGLELFPQVDSGQFVLRFRTPPGTNYELTRQAWIRCLQIIEEEVGPGNVTISMGFAGQQAPNFGLNNLLLFMRGPDDGQMRVALRQGSVKIEALRERLRRVLPERLIPWFAGLLRREGLPADQAEERATLMTFAFEPGDIVSEVMSFGAPAPIEIVLSGPDLPASRHHAEKVLAALQDIPALRDVQIQQTLDYPTVPITIDRQKAGLSGVDTQQVGQSVLVTTSSSRMVARNFWQDPKSGVSYQVQVQVPIQRMNSPSQVETVPLQEVSPLVNLMVRDVARSGSGFVPGEYDRLSSQRYLSITANVEGEDLGRAARQVQDALQRAGQTPHGVSVSTRGQVAPMEEMFRSLAIGLAAAVFVILVLLTAYFQSLRLAVISLGAVPGVLSGVVLVLYFTGTTLNIESFMGAIMSIGVSVSNSVMLVTFTSRDWREGQQVQEAAIRGARERLRPILMTACAMIVGMVPISLALEAGSEIEAPLGRAVIGGLLVSTFATLLLLPAFFALIMGKSRYQSPSVYPDDPESPHHHPESAESREGEQPGEKSRQRSPKSRKEAGLERRANKPRKERPGDGMKENKGMETREPREAMKEAPMRRTITVKTVCCLVLLAGCGKQPPPAKPIQVEPHVRLARVQSRTIVREVGQPGYIDAYEQTALYAKVSGYIQKWNVDIGDRIKKDQVLAQFFVPELEVEYKEKKAQADLDEVQIQVAERVVEVATSNWKAAGAQVQEARANVGKYQAAVERWESEVNRLTGVAAEGVLAPQVLSESQKQLKANIAAREAAQATTQAAEASQVARKADIDKAKIDVQAARARARVSEQAVQRLAALVGYTRLLAPYDGIVVDRKANTGDYVQPGSGDLTGGRGTPIYVVARTDTVRVYVDVPEVDAPFVQKGTKATVRIQALNYDVIDAPVTRTSWALRQRSRTLRAEIDLPNPDARLLPAMYAYAKVRIQRSNVKAVPLAAVVEIGNQNYCFLYEKGKAIQTAVQTGINDGKWVEVIRKKTDGNWVPLHGDEEVILGELAELSNGEAVQVSKGK